MGTKIAILILSVIVVLAMSALIMSILGVCGAAVLCLIGGWTFSEAFKVSVLVALVIEVIAYIIKKVVN